MFSPIRVVCQNTLSAALGVASSHRHRDSSIRIRHTKNADSLLARLPELVDVRRRQFIGGLDELRHMAATPCSVTQFRQYITTVFADQLQGTVNDVRGNKSTARPKELEDLPGWTSILGKFQGEAIGSNLPASSGTAWGAYQAVTEFMTHESGNRKDPTEAARKRLESIFWGQGYKAISIAHEEALSIS
jgi:hypothetical protein